MPDYNYDLGFLADVAGISRERKFQLLKFFTLAEDPVRLEAFMLTLQNIQKIQHRNKPHRRVETLYAAFVIALDSMVRLEESTIRRRGEHLDEARARKQFKIRVARIKARRQKSTLVKRLIEVRWFDEISKLRDEEKMSWRRIVRYIGQSHKMKISHTYIREAFLKIERIRQTPEGK